MMNKTPGNDFDVMTIRLASPSRILEWSRGEVTKAETINYRTQRSEKHGLFDEKIFGPEKDYECYCGKYRGIRYKGIVCEKCGVEVTRAIVRRERMGHIELASPVAHVWFLRGVPSRIALILGIPAADAEKVIYFASYIIVKVVQEDKDRFLKELDNEYKTKWKSLEGNEQARDDLKEKFTTTKSEIEGISIGRVLDEGTYHRFSVRYGTIFEASTGAEAIYGLFKKVDVEGLLGELEGRREKATALEREKLTKRISLLKAMRQSGVRPEWMFLTHIPVMPPALRPMVALEGGRHATSDLNDLYRRVINRNNRLKKLREIGAPEVILRNEKRILQEAVDALIDNTIRRGGAAYSALTQAQRRPLKSLSDYLKGKHGYFRANLLGKRVDYSGRSVIVVGPELKLDQCGLPKHMALELFKPFVIAKLLERELAYNIRGAGRLIEEGVPEVWGILEEVITGRHVLLNRAPTLHRQGIQAFRPVLIEGNAIQLHPLVCRAFNADFDGDQMAVHVPLSEEAQLEAREIMSANKNILKPGSGTSVVSEKMLDIAYGTYYTTSIKEGEPGEGKDFPTPNAAIAAMDYGAVSLRARIKVLGTDSPKYAEFGGKVFETSVGRLLFNSILPAEYPFVNAEVTQKVVGRIVDELIERFGLSRIPEIIDRVKAFGFHYATKSGLTWAIDDIVVPEAKHAIIEKAKKTVNEIVMQYEEGLLSEDERVRLSIEIWTRTKLEVEKLVKESLDRESPVFGMVESGARGSWAQLTMMVGMKGLTQSTTGEAIEFPIVASLKEGLSPIEYFLTTHGSRSGLANVALGTARAGYLTRRLFDVAQDSLVIEDDCGSVTGIPLTSVSASGIETNISKIIKGRTLSKEVVAGDTTFKANHTLNSADALAIERASVTEVWVRSPMACETLHGSCRKCYGFDQTTNALIDVGEAVGTIAAQAIGEPGTQLSMNTKHAGGAASLGGDITQGLPRIEELFENRTPKTPAVISHVSGTIMDIRDAEGGEKVVVIAPSLEDRNLNKKMGDLVEYEIPFRRTPLVRMGEDVVKGQILTDGSADLSELFVVAGRVRTQAYLIAEVSKIYELQGVSISRKHIEVIVRHMFGRVRITRPGDTRFAIGDVAEEWDVREENARVGASHGSPAEANPILLGITDAAINRKSFLSAASFQNTTRVLINASVRGSTDPLSGLKENVIIGRLIPAGSGFPGSAKHAIVGDLQAAMTPPAPEPEVSIVPTLEEALGEK